MAQKTKRLSVIADLNAFYKPLEQGLYLPQDDPFQGSPTNVIVRDLVVDMEELNDKLTEHAPHWQNLEVYADVLVFPLYSETYDEFAFKLGAVEGQKASFFARTIILADGTGLFVNYKSDTQLSIYTSEIIGDEFSFYGLDGKPNQGTPIIIEDDALGVLINGPGSGPDSISKPLYTLQPDKVNHNSAGYWLLESSFNIGSVMVYDDPKLASNILSWVANTSAYGTDLDATHLALNAANLQGYAEQLQRHIPFVPPLDADVYEDVTKDFVKSATVYEQNFHDITAQENSQADFGTYVKDNSKYFTDQTQAGKQLIDQMRDNVANAEKLLDQNTSKLRDIVKYEGTLQTTREAFLDGIKKYKEEQKRKAIIGICMAVFEVGGAMAAMAAGDEAAAGSAVKGVEGAAKAAETTAKVASKMSKLVESVKKIVKVMKKLAELVKKLKAAQEAMEKLTKANDISAPKITKDIEIKPDDGEILDGAYWDVYALSVSGILTPYKDDIDGTSEYLEQLLDLGIYGKNVYLNSLTLTDLQQKLFKLVLDEKVAKNQQERLSQLVADETTQVDHLQMVKVLGYQNLLRVKSRLIYYMDQQIAAYRYWAVSATLSKQYAPSLRDSVGGLDEKLSNISADRIQKMRKFQPGPSEMDEHITLDDPDMIAKLRDTRQLTWNLPLSQSEFISHGRIRIKKFRVYLNSEAVLEPSKQVSIQVQTSGQYYDRFKSEPVLRYATDPFDKTFVYSPHQDIPIYDGTISDEKEYAYFEPTPFTTWKFNILNDSELKFYDPKSGKTKQIYEKERALDAEIDYEKITSVTIHFFGWASDN